MLQLIINSVLLGVGLAMDAFSISIANGIVEPGMRKRRMLLIAGVYAVFQFMMPMLGWLLVTTLEEIFTKFSILIPWIALVLLLGLNGIDTRLEVIGINERQIVGRIIILERLQPRLSLSQRINVYL